MKISAILSAYYCERFLAKRIENLRSQADTEIVTVAQTGSPEEKILHAAAIKQKNEDNDFVVIGTKDVPTVYAAWNMAIEAATGEYITSANSDDLAYEGAFEKMARALDEHPKFAMAYFDVDRINNFDEPRVINRFQWMEGGLKELYWQGCFLGPMPMWRKSLHEKYGYFDGDFHTAGDFEFWLRLAAGGERFYHMRGEVLGAHLERDDSLEHRSGLRASIEAARARAKYRQRMEGPEQVTLLELG